MLDNMCQRHPTHKHPIILLYPAKTSFKHIHTTYLTIMGKKDQDTWACWLVGQHQLTAVVVRTWIAECVLNSVIGTYITIDMHRHMEGFNINLYDHPVTIMGLQLDNT